MTSQTQKESRPLTTDDPRQLPKNRSDGSATIYILPQRRRKAKRKLKLRPRFYLALACLLVIITAVVIATRPTEQPTAQTETIDRPEAPAPESVAGYPAAVVDAQEETAEPEPEPIPAPLRYELTAPERDLVERVVMAEAEGEPYEGQVAVAQCILNACEKDGIRPEEAISAYKYASARPEPSSSVKAAVSAVFDDGETATDEPIIYFYNPARATSSWHESQISVIEIERHRFFAEKGATP